MVWCDPPFFQIKIEDIRRSIEVISKNRSDFVVCISFTKLYERQFLGGLKQFRVQPTRFSLQFATIHPTKWNNYVLYSNRNLDGMMISV